MNEIDDNFINQYVQYQEALNNVPKNSKTQEVNEEINNKYIKAIEDKAFSDLALYIVLNSLVSYSTTEDFYDDNGNIIGGYRCCFNPLSRVEMHFSQMGRGVLDLSDKHPEFKKVILNFYKYSLIHRKKHPEASKASTKEWAVNRVSYLTKAFNDYYHPKSLFQKIRDLVS